MAELADLGPALAKLKELAGAAEDVRSHFHDPDDGPECRAMDAILDPLFCGAADKLRAIADVFDEGMGRENIWRQ
jgi:hypothetical protein